jgi:hypothetical protein
MGDIRTLRLRLTHQVQHEIAIGADVAARRELAGCHSKFQVACLLIGCSWLIHNVAKHPVKSESFAFARYDDSKRTATQSKLQGYNVDIVLIIVGRGPPSLSRTARAEENRQQGTS